MHFRVIIMLIRFFILWKSSFVTTGPVRWPTARKNKRPEYYLIYCAASREPRDLKILHDFVNSNAEIIHIPYHTFNIKPKLKYPLAWSTIHHPPSTIVLHIDFSRHSVSNLIKDSILWWIDYVYWDVWYLFAAVLQYQGTRIGTLSHESKRGQLRLHSLIRHSQRYIARASVVEMLPFQYLDLAFDSYSTWYSVDAVSSRWCLRLRNWE